MGSLSNEEWISRFEAELKRRFHDRSTAKHYVSDLRLFVRFHPGVLAEVTSLDLAAFVDRQREQGRRPATIKRRVAALKTFFDFVAATLADPQRVNPVSVRAHAGRESKRLPRDLSDADVERFLAVVDACRDRAMVCLMLYAGLRVGEVATLRAADLSEPADPTAPIRLRVLGKGRKERVVYLCREGYQPLVRYLQEEPPTHREGPLFRSRWGRGLSVDAIEERVSHYAQRSGVTVTCHRLRHTYGRWMVEGEMPVLTLARLLGHTSVHTTQRYIEGADPQVRRGYDAAMGRRPSSPPALPSVAISSPTPRDAGPAVVVRPETPLIADADWLPDAPAWVRESCGAWLRHQWYQWKPTQRRHHARQRERDLRRFWDWQLTRREFAGWGELTRADLAAFMEAELGRGVRAKTVKTTIDRVYEVMRYLKEVKRLGALPERPALRLPDALPRHLAPREVVALEETVARLRGATAPGDQLDRALYYLLGHGGLRISEALDLQVQDVDLEARRVFVREGKGRRDRVVYLTTEATAGVREYLATVPHASGDLVLSWQGRPLTYELAWVRLAALGKQAGVSGVSPHRLRHTYATVLLNNGLRIEALRDLMGHENLTTTMIYARLADQTLERQYRAAMEQTPITAVNSV